MFGNQPDEKVGSYSIQQAVSPIPLPASVLMLLASIGALGLLRRGAGAVPSVG